MPSINARVRSNSSDENQRIIDEIALQVFVKMNIISQESFDAVKGDATKQIKLLQTIENLQGKKELEFSERFIDTILAEDQDYLDCVPPYTLALAYTQTKKRLEDSNLSQERRDKLENRLDKVTKRIDSLIKDFAENIGYHFVDTTNIADVYAGYNKMFDARESDLKEDSNLRQQIKLNRVALENYIKKYDDEHGISTLDEKESDAATIEKNYDAATNIASGWQPSEETLYSASRYKFLNKKGEEKPQFIDDKGNLTTEYKPGYTVLSNGELNDVLDLVRHDFSLDHIKDNPVETMSEDEVQQELDQDALHKLFELDTAEKIAKGCTEDPERFTDPKHFQDFISNLNANGGSISEQGYEAAMDAQVNKTAGFAARVKQKLGKFGNKATGFFGKVFKPIQKIDKRKDDRIEGQTPKDKRQKRMEFIVRMLKGFGCAFLVSTTITVIAAAAATISGASLALSLAVIGIVSSVAMAGIQLHKWRKARREAGEDAGIQALLKDRRMMMTLGTSAIAAIALAFGAAGVTAAAATLGYGALTLGASNNALSTYQDAKNAGMGKAESIAWALANAAAVVAGGFMGRFAGKAISDSAGLNTRTETHTETRKIGEHEETDITYKQETLDNAERIAKMWYRDNPDLLQQRVDMVNEYNAAHGTHIDPYRAVMLNADAGGMTADNMALHVDGGGVVHSGGYHTVLTPHWGSEHGTSVAEIDALRNMFNGPTISDDAMAAAMKVDQMVSPINEVGITTGAPVHLDHVLKPLNVDLGNGQMGYSTYANGNSPIDVTTRIVEDFGNVDVTTQTQVDSSGLMATFGNYNKEHKAKLKGRPGSLADKKDEITPLVPPKEQKQIEDRGGRGLLEMKKPEEKHLFITYEDAKKINKHREKLAKLREVLSASNEKRESAELRRAINKYQGNLNEVLNRYGDPDKDVLADAMQHAYKRHDLEEKEKELAEKQEFNPTGKRAAEIKYHEYEIAKAQEEIEQLKSEIPAEDTFYRAVSVKHNLVEGKQTEASKAKKDNKKHADEIHEKQSFAAQFDHGQSIVKELNKKKDKNESDSFMKRIFNMIGKDNFEKLDKATLINMSLFDFVLPSGLSTDEMIDRYITRHPQDIDIFHQNGVRFEPGKKPVNMRGKGRIYRR